MVQLQSASWEPACCAKGLTSVGWCFTCPGMWLVIWWRDGLRRCGFIKSSCLSTLHVCWVPFVYIFKSFDSLGQGMRQELLSSPFNREAEAQWSEVTCPSSHSQQVALCPWNSKSLLQACGSGCWERPQRPPEKYMGSGGSLLHYAESRMS